MAFGEICESIRALAAMLNKQDDMEKLMDDDEFATELDELYRLCNDWHPGPPRQSPTRRRKSKNRLVNKLCDDWSPGDFSPEVEAVIWNWAADPDSFFHPVAETAPTRPTCSMLDSVVRLLNRLDTEITVNHVRSRLLLCFLVEFVDEQIAGVSDTAEICRLLVQAKLVSPGVEPTLAASLPKWLGAGRRYMSLADELGGWGALLLLPNFAPTTYEHHYHPVGRRYRSLIIQRLRRKVPAAAREKRSGGPNAYEVADALRQHWRKERPLSFLSCDPSRRRDRPAGQSTQRRRPGPGNARRGSTVDRRGRGAPQSPQTPSVVSGSVGEEVPSWQVPLPTAQSPWDGGDPEPDDTSTTQLSFLAHADDCRLIFPGSSAPLVV